MYASWSDNHWNNTHKRQLITFVISGFVLFLILLIPVQRQLREDPFAKSIEIVFAASHPQKEPTTQFQSVIKHAKPSSKKEEFTQQSKPNKKSKPSIKESTKTKTIEVQALEQNTEIKNQTQKLPSSAEIINAFNNRSSYRAIDKDFQASSQAVEDFKFKPLVKSKIYRVDKYINEEIDKPEVEMDFYSDGIVGSTERFFDKITYKKVFKTRYGTKIYCGGIGPLLVCSWK